MKRRNFLQWALSVLGIAYIPNDIIIANETNTEQEWQPVKCQDFDEQILGADITYNPRGEQEEVLLFTQTKIYKFNLETNTFDEYKFRIKE